MSTAFSFILRHLKNKINFQILNFAKACMKVVRVPTECDVNALIITVQNGNTKSSTLYEVLQRQLRSAAEQQHTYEVDTRFCTDRF